MKSEQPRGIRNNNPLNIRHNRANMWRGRASSQTDPDFVQFGAMVYGIRAAYVIMIRYLWRYPNMTLSHLINVWAPSTENNTQRYIDFMCAQLSLPHDYQLKNLTKYQWVALASAMIRYENGKSVDEADIVTGLDMAASSLGIMLQP